jgi:hypothetical protein
MKKHHLWSNELNIFTNTFWNLSETFSVLRDLLRLKFSQEDEEEYELSDEEYEQDPPASSIMKQVFLFPSKRFKFSLKFC